MERLDREPFPDGFVSIWRIGSHYSVQRWQLGRGTLQVPFLTLAEAKEAYAQWCEGWAA